MGMYRSMTALAGCHWGPNRSEAGEFLDEMLDEWVGDRHTFCVTGHKSRYPRQRLEKITTDHPKGKKNDKKRALAICVTKQ